MRDQNRIGTSKVSPTFVFRSLSFMVFEALSVKPLHNSIRSCPGKRYLLETVGERLKEGYNV
jgi:hypothetical protein